MQCYKFVHVSRQASQFDGTAAYINESFTVSILNIFQYQSFEHLSLKIYTGATNLIVSVIYRPPDFSLTAFLSHFPAYIDELEKLATQYMFAGDFNINLLQYNSSSVSNFIATIYSRSLYPIVTLPTRISDYSATVIDNILINNSHKLSGIIYANI